MVKIDTVISPVYLHDLIWGQKVNLWWKVMFCSMCKRFIAWPIWTKTIHCVIHSVLNKNNTNLPKSYFLYFYQKYLVLVDPKNKVMSFSFKHHIMKFQYLKVQRVPVNPKLDITLLALIVITFCYFNTMIYVHVLWYKYLL